MRRCAVRGKALAKVKIADTLLALHKGKPVQQVIYAGLDRLTKDNVPEFNKRSARREAGRIRQCRLATARHRQWWW